MVIESTSNNLIKRASSLRLKKFRDESNQFLAEGIKLISDICLSNPSLVDAIFITEQYLKKVSDSGYLLPKDKLVLVSQKVIKGLCSATNPQEITAIIDKPIERLSGDYILFLDKIQDPGNLGTILRTALASNYSLILNNCVDVYSPKVIQGSMGAILNVPFIRGSIDTLKQLKQSGYKIFSLDLDGENLFSAKKESRICLIIGNEGNGIQKEVRDLSEKILTIPMEKTESLNAAISAAISMYYFKFF